jgi:hypothetical protein
VLGRALQLTDQLLLQQQPQRQAASQPGLPQRSSSPPGTSTSTTINTRNSDRDSDSSGISDRCLPSHATKPEADRAALTPLLLRTLGFLQWSSISSSTASPAPDTHAAVGGLAAVATPAVAVLAERFVEVCTALEVGLRVTTTAVQQGASYEHPELIDLCANYQLAGTSTATDGSNFPKCLLVRHLGLRGPTTQVVELRRFYSLLSTVQKLGRCQEGTGHELVWDSRGQTRAAGQ